MGSTAKPDVEELQFKLGELPPGITAEHFRSRVIAPARRAGWRTSGNELPDGYFGVYTQAGDNWEIGTQGCTPRALVQCAYEGPLCA
jgi:hypothetical protein